jgi:hypothetical protein
MGGCGIQDGKNSDPRYRMGKNSVLGSEMEKIRIQDKHLGSATLLPTQYRYRMSVAFGGLILVLYSVNVNSVFMNASNHSRVRYGYSWYDIKFRILTFIYFIRLIFPDLDPDTHNLGLHSEPDSQHYLQP